MGVVDVDVRILRHLKEELAWATDKCLQVISTKYRGGRYIRVLVVNHGMKSSLFAFLKLP